MLSAVQVAWQMDSGCVPRIATPFGGGIGRTGLTCGALVGAVMAVGLKLGRSGEAENRDPSYDAAWRLVNGFRRRFGATSCLDLTGLDLTTPEGRSAWGEQNLAEKCTQFVVWAVDEVCRIMR